ncbi:MAG: DeoR/GlpR transcriptional regulator [Candidatus Brocadiaceae bacterium]|nr:DeoR/GlpR transcriptional regulator [Candidatus Brocadiaceae bacterium]
MPAERQQRIIEILKKDFSTRSSNLSELLGVSEMTIRRDLDVLEGLESGHGNILKNREKILKNISIQRRI